MSKSRILASFVSVAALAALVACGGGGGAAPPTGSGGGPPPTNPPTSPPSNPPPTNPPITVSSTVYQAYDGAAHSWGSDTWQTNGVTTSDSHDGDTVNNVGPGQTTDGLSACAMPNEAAATGYHHHVFVGIYVNGNPMAVPDAIGMANPSSDDPITNFTCAYAVHTHGESGIIHIEDPTLPQSTTPPSQYNLQTLLDIWGQSLNTLDGASGPPAIYVGTPSSTINNGTEDLVTSYSLYTGSPTNLVFAKHTAIWLIYGAPPSGGVPQVAFGIST